MEVVSADVAVALADREGGGDLGEGEVFCRTAGALLPVEEKLAVAVGEARGVVDAEGGQGAVNPLGWAFDLGVVADGGLVDDEVYGGFDSVRPLGAVLLVGEGWKVAELAEDFGESGAFSYGCF